MNKTNYLELMVEVLQMAGMTKEEAYISLAKFFKDLGTIYIANLTTELKDPNKKAHFQQMVSQSDNYKDAFEYCTSQGLDNQRILRETYIKYFSAFWSELVKNLPEDKQNAVSVQLSKLDNDETIKTLLSSMAK